MAALTKSNMKLSTSISCDSARCQSDMTNLPSSFDYSLLILETDGGCGLFFFLIRAHPKVKTILNKGRHGPVIKMLQSSCAVSP